MTTIWACSGDDNSGPPAVDGGMDGSMSPETSTVDAPKDNTAPDVREASTTDSPAEAARDVRDAGPADARDAAPEAAPDAPADAPADARSGDADATAMDAGEAGPDAPAEGASDAGVDAAGSTALNLCPVLDPQWGLMDNACPTTSSSTANGGCGSDRPNAWANDIPTSFAMGNLNTDCRISSMLSAITMNDVTDWLANLTFWTEQVMGCPVTPAMDAGTYGYGLVPPALQAHIFTSADLALLSDLYVAAVQDAFVNGSATAVTNPPLTAQQYSDLQARLAYLAAQYPGVLQSSTYSFDTCPTDAGTDARDAASDAPGGG